MSLSVKLKSAYETFKNLADSHDHEKLLTLLENAQASVIKSIKAKEQKPLHSEISYALSLLGHDKSDPSFETHLSLLKPHVKPDGTIMGTGKWELLDIGWIESLIGWFEHLENRASFSTSPANVKIGDKLSLAVAGDWGTGPWKPDAPSIKIGRCMKALNPDITVHLGDVYYSGTAEEEVKNLADVWPFGSFASFTLNSNHEMYNGAISYFDLLNSHFPQQNGCSYFSMENEHWLIIGLDTAYYSDMWNLYMDGALDDAQLTWLESLPEKPGVIIFSHHTGLDITGHSKEKIYDLVLSRLKSQKVFWYWGHLHNAIVYRPVNNVYNRCIGHGAIPYGDTSEVANLQNVQWYENKLADDPQLPIRVLNGFAHISLEGNTLKEKLISENGRVRFQNLETL